MEGLQPGLSLIPPVGGQLRGENYQAPMVFIQDEGPQDAAYAATGGMFQTQDGGQGKEERARTKNREAQQRFRQRQRQKQEEAAMQCEELEVMMEDLRFQNESLQVKNAVMEKVLAVRDAMFTVYNKTANVDDKTPQWRELKGAGYELAMAIDRLNSDPLIDEIMADTSGPPSPPESSKDAPQKSEGTATDVEQPNGSDSADALAPEGSTMSMSLSAAAWENAESLDGAPLQEVENIPPPDNSAVRLAVYDMKNPSEIVEYWRGWTRDLKVAWEAADAASFDDASVARVHQVMEVMTEMWWHAAQLKPPYLAYLTHAALPDNSSQQECWERIAREILPELTLKDLDIMRKAWRKYTKSLAKTAIAAQQCADDLRNISVPDDYLGLAPNANVNVLLDEVAESMAAAVQQEYIASMEFLADQSVAWTTLQRAFLNYAAIPYMPDVVAIIYHILKIVELRPPSGAQIASVSSPANGSGGEKKQ